ncbi:MAG: AMP-binding protein [Clostridia bacterium]|nr:AMP-binding protein [Clostridia bacterium]
MAKFNVGNYVKKKIELLGKTDKTFRAIYELTFREEDLQNVMLERTDGNKIKRITYGECRKEIEKFSRALNSAFASVEKGTFLGLYAQNSAEWIYAFWAILKCGYKPLLLNTRLEDERLKETLSYYEIGGVVSDGKRFSYPTKTIDELSAAANAAPELSEHTETNETTDTETWADEIAVMSSGTSLTSKLCVYKGENFYHQICDTAGIMKTCKQLAAHYQGSLKQLLFLPLYHIFGFSAVLLRFAFFSRTFVLLKDQSPETILYTVRKHKVTHIFAVPLFWETVYKSFYAKLKTRGEKAEIRVAKGLRLVNKTGSVWLGKRLFREVRDNLFGESIQFLISGGSAIRPEVLRFFNAIGYRLANGFGMSEVGITSLEGSSKYKDLTDGGIGKPFLNAEYKRSETGSLLIKGPSSASEIYVNGKPTKNGEWYDACDMAEEKKGRWFILGRKDDMLIGADGENLNPDWAERNIRLQGAERFCIVKMNGEPTLLVQIRKFMPREARWELEAKARNELTRIGVSATVRSVAFTEEPLLLGDEFKLNRRRLETVKPLLGDGEAATETDDELTERVKALFAKALGRETEKVGKNAHFFFDLKGSSLDYFSLITDMQREFGVSFPQSESEGLYTVADFVKFIRNV